MPCHAPRAERYWRDAPARSGFADDAAFIDYISDYATLSDIFADAAIYAAAAAA